MVRSLRLVAAAFLLLAVATLAPAALAHGAPEDEIENEEGKGRFVRVLGDRTDDCGAEAPATNDCRGAHDLVGIDVQELWDGTQNVLVVRFWLDKARSPSYPTTDTFGFAAAGAKRTLSISTSDDATFQVQSGFTSTGNAVRAGGGTRFHVDARVPFSALNLQPGTALSGFHAESRVPAGVGDAMPGDCTNSTPTPCESRTPEDNDLASYNRGTYTLQGPTYYASVAAPTAPAQVAQGAETIVQLQVTNLLKAPQAMTLTVEGAHGVEARFHNPSMAHGHGYSDEGKLSLPKGGSSVVHLALQGTTAGSTGTLTLTLTTDLGGRIQNTIAYEVTEPGTGTCTPGMHGETCPSTNTTSKASPVLAPPILLAALAILARTRRS